jgi:hypothetical protein
MFEAKWVVTDLTPSSCAGRRIFDLSLEERGNLMGVGI